MLFDYEFLPKEPADTKTYQPTISLYFTGENKKKIINVSQGGGKTYSI